MIFCHKLLYPYLPLWILAFAFVLKGANNSSVNYKRRLVELNFRNNDSDFSIMETKLFSGCLLQYSLKSIVDIQHNIPQCFHSNKVFQQ